LIAGIKILRRQHDGKKREKGCLDGYGKDDADHLYPEELISERQRNRLNTGIEIH
jgi:hypothetical protein